MDLLKHAEVIAHWLARLAGLEMRFYLREDKFEECRARQFCLLGSERRMF